MVNQNEDQRLTLDGQPERKSTAILADRWKREPPRMLWLIPTANSYILDYGSLLKTGDILEIKLNQVEHQKQNSNLYML